MKETYEKRITTLELFSYNYNTLITGTWRDFCRSKLGASYVSYETSLKVVEVLNIGVELPQYIKSGDENNRVSPKDYTIRLENNVLTFTSILDIEPVCRECLSDDISDCYPAFCNKTLRDPDNPGMEIRYCNNCKSLEAVASEGALLDEYTVKGKAFVRESGNVIPVTGDPVFVHNGWVLDIRVYAHASKRGGLHES